MNANTKVAERKCYINGRFVASGKQFPKINPVDGSVVAQVHEADRAMAAPSFPRKPALDSDRGRESSVVRKSLDPRFRGDDVNIT